MAHYILGGSLEQDGTLFTAAVHTGPSEWKPENLRYVRAELDHGRIGDTVQSLLFRTYDTTVGCLVAGGYGPKP